MMQLREIGFAAPVSFAALGLLPLGWWLRRRRRPVAVRYARVDILARGPGSACFFAACARRCEPWPSSPRRSPSRGRMPVRGRRARGKGSTSCSYSTFQVRCSPRISSRSTAWPSRKSKLRRLSGWKSSAGGSELEMSSTSMMSSAFTARCQPRAPELGPREGERPRGDDGHGSASVRAPGGEETHRSGPASKEPTTKKKRPGAGHGPAPPSGRTGTRQTKPAPRSRSRAIASSLARLMEFEGGAPRRRSASAPPRLRGAPPRRHGRTRRQTWLVASAALGGTITRFSGTEQSLCSASAGAS